MYIYTYIQSLKYVSFNVLNMKCMYNVPQYVV